jgi:peptidoglycan hydrolase-like protein with peptidoglycan-binding domain
VHNSARDLACPELWADSLVRSRARRQQEASRLDLIPGRKGLALAGVVAATAVPVATAAAAGSGLLQRGDDGGRVRGVQHRLGIGGDGEFGPHTEHAVRMFQKRNGLDVDGVVGAATLTKLRGGSGGPASRACRSASASPPTASSARRPCGRSSASSPATASPATAWSAPPPGRRPG